MAKDGYPMEPTRIDPEVWAVPTTAWDLRKFSDVEVQFVAAPSAPYQPQRSLDGVNYVNCNAYDANGNAVRTITAAGIYSFDGNCYLKFSAGAGSTLTRRAVTAGRGNGRSLSTVTRVNPATSSSVVSTLDASGNTAPFVPEVGRPLYVNLSGAWTGTVTVQRSFDGGATWLPITVGGGEWGIYTKNVSEQVDTPTSASITYRLNFVRNSGTLAYELRQ